MLSLLNAFWDAVSPEQRRKRQHENFMKECDYFDELVSEEEKQEEANATNGVRNYFNYINSKTNESGKKFDVTECSKQVGTITHLDSNNGVIDETVVFDLELVSNRVNELKVGNRVKYLLYQNPRTEHLTVVSIESMPDQFWDDIDNDNNGESNVFKEESKFDVDKEYFEVSQHNILGLVVKKKLNSLRIETEYKVIEVNMNSTKCEFAPFEGDRVYICCKMQKNEEFVDQQGEILDTIAIYPARILTEEKCTVSKVHQEWAILNNDIIVTTDVIPAGITLNIDDVVIADIIECDRGKFNWRCIRLSLHRKNTNIKQTENAIQNENQAVTVSPDQRCVFIALEQKQDVLFTITNNCARTMKASGIIIINSQHRSPLISLNDPEKQKGFEINAKGNFELQFKVESKFYGESRESFLIDFGSFRVKRSVTVIVCEDEEKASKALSNTSRFSLPFGSNRGRARFNANKVWSKEYEVIPGVSLHSRRRFVARHIPGFEVPQRLRNAYLSQDRKDQITDNIEGLYPCLTEEINFKNYVQRFQVLLHLEEIEYFMNVRKYDRERASFRHEGEYLALTIEDLSERRPSIVIGDIIRATNPFTEKSPSYDGVIHKVRADKVLLKFNPSFHGTYKMEDYRIEFHFSRFVFRKAHYATERIVKHLGQQFLFPSSMVERNEVQLDLRLDEDLNMHLHGQKLRWFNTKLNEFQKRAIYNILRGESFNTPYVIFGPPGTGKTITIVETILQLLKHVKSSRLLVGAPSNSGANLIANRLIESGEVLPGDFVRLVSLNLIEQELIPENLMPYCATVDIGIDGSCKSEMTVTESGLKLRCQMKYLGRHRITISTCSTLGSYLQMNFPSDHFSHVLIDECGQCTEPEAMIAITQVARRRGQVILAGDPKQLSPVVVNRYATESGLSLSFMERILGRTPYRKDIIRFPNSCGYNPCLVTKLLYNYRALPSILKVYNDLFYDAELLSVINPETSKEADLLKTLNSTILRKSKTRHIAHGSFFYGVRSENMQDKDSPSWYNALEARNIFLWTIRLYRQKISAQNIGIITPYARQVKFLRNMFVTASVEVPKIGTVEEFQGQERDVILISTVRSCTNLISKDLKHSLGFVHCEKRMNVAISRARALQIVFGNPHLLCIDPCWYQFLEYCVKNDAYDGCDLPDCFNME